MPGSGTPDSVRAEIQSNALRVGNPVNLASGLIAIASLPLYGDANSLLAQGAYPFSVPITPSAATTTFLNLTGTATSDSMSKNVVVDGAGGATTFTKKGYVKVSIVDSGGVMTSGDYYIQVGLLS